MVKYKNINDVKTEKSEEKNAPETLDKNRIGKAEQSKKETASSSSVKRNAK